MKCFSLFLLSTLLLFSCSTDTHEIGPDNMVSGARVKAFSSCGEIEGIVSGILYSNRVLEEDNSWVEDSPYRFKCEWEQEQHYDPSDLFIMRMTTVRYANGELMSMTREEVLDHVDGAEVTDPRLNHSYYSNVLITKGFNPLLKANTYIAYIWVENERIDRIIIQDINVSENVPELLADAMAADLFIPMLEPVS